MTSKQERTHSVVLDCIRCKVTQPEIKVKKQDYDQWADNGRLIQVAMPYLSADEREILITQLCPSCWEKLYVTDNSTDIQTGIRVNKNGVPEVVITTHNATVAVLLDGVLIYGDSTTNLKRFNVPFTAQDVMALPSWRHGDNRKRAERFLEQHLSLLRDSLRDEGKMFLDSVLSTWEGPNP